MVVREVQSLNMEPKLVPDEVSRSGISVREEQNLKAQDQSVMWPRFSPPVTEARFAQVSKA